MPYYLFRVSSLIYTDTKTKSLIFSMRSYYVYMPWGFVTKYFLIFIVDEVKNFAANNNIWSC